MAQALCPPRPGHAPGALASCFSRLNETQRRLGLAGRALVWRPRSIPRVRTASAPCPRSAPAAPTLSLAGHPESEPVAPLLNALASDLRTQTRRASSGSAGRRGRSLTPPVPRRPSPHAAPASPPALHTPLLLLVLSISAHVHLTRGRLSRSPRPGGPSPGPPSLVSCQTGIRVSRAIYLCGPWMHVCLLQLTEGSGEQRR